MGGIEDEILYCHARRTCFRRLPVPFLADISPIPFAFSLLSIAKFVLKGFIRLRVAVMEGEIRLFVEDSGPGVPEAKRDELFTKYQVSLDRLKQGTGLGLNLSKKLMNSMNGDIWLDESYDSGIEGCPGACFVIQLNTVPLDIESSLPMPSIACDDSYHVTTFLKNEELPQNDAILLNDDVSSSQSVIIGTPPIPNDGTETQSEQQRDNLESTVRDLPDNVTVLFVDDDAVLRKLFVRGIKRAAPSWIIQEASSGEAALHLCETKSFDIIFMDQYMASASKQLLGTEAVAEMRSMGVASIICGLSANDIRDSFVGAGANEFVLKPIPCKPDCLRAVLTKLLDHKNIA